MPISAQTGDVTWHHGHAAKRKALRICSSFPPIATSTAAISQWPLNVCAVTRRRFSSGCEPHPANAPAGSNRSSHGGDEMAEAFGVAGHV